jgi:hypothetical protein
MAFGSSQSHCPKKSHESLFNLYSSNGNSINKHLCTNTCLKSTLSPNNLMLKLIMFAEEIKQLYSRIEIKTLKQGKTMFGYQTLSRSPMRRRPKNPLPPAPFCLLSTFGSNFLQLCCPSPLQAFLPFVSFLCVTLIAQLPRRSPFYVGWVPPNLMFAPRSVSSLHMGQTLPDSILATLSVSSPCTC